MDRKVSMLFFLMGSLLALFSGAFQTATGLGSIMVGMICILGFLVGSLNVEKKNEGIFLIACSAFMVFALSMKIILPELHPIVIGLTNIATNLLFFIGCAAAAVSIRIIIRVGSELEGTTTKMDVTPSHERNFAYYWNIVVFVAVAMMFIIFVLRQFYKTESIEEMLMFIDFLIWTIFVTDLFFLYSRAGSMKEFFKKSWLDIIATIPVSGELMNLNRLAKLGRFAKLGATASKATKISRASKAAKLMHGAKLSKYFSKESGFNEIIQEDITEKKKNQRKRKK